MKKPPPTPSSVKLRIRRGDERTPGAFDEFEVALGPDATVHAALLAVRDRPVTTDGRSVDPPAWDVGCLEGGCGTCTIRIDGRARLACTTRLGERRPGAPPLRLEPLARFHQVRDLVVDRARQDDARRRACAGQATRIDPGSEPAGEEAEPPNELPEARDLRSALSACIGCGACFEACPETGPGRPFMGAEAIAHNRLATLHPALPPAARESLTRALMVPGGIADCGKAQACVDACPEGVPLIEALADAARDTSSSFLFGWMRR